LTDRSPLPDFTNPPVIEVALSAQFERLTDLHAAHLGLLWDEFRERFPKTEEHPPRDTVIESFGVFTPSRLRVQLETVMPVPRVWFLNEAGTELIQVQQETLVHNWRKAGVPTATYPRYESIRRTFQDELDTFVRFVERERIGRVVPVQCEIAYVNHIPAGDGWNDFGELERVLSPWSGRYSDDFLPRPEQVRIGSRYVIHGSDNEPIGRLNVDCVPAVDAKSHTPMFILTLTARGKPLSEGLDGVLAFLDVGRGWIVRGFASITTPAMHQLWGRTDVR
jgi:uncharacterized protein (TIGR04255 family)